MHPHLFMLICLALIGLGLSLCLTPVLTRVLETLNVMDMPDGHRKLHARAVPRLGGVSVMFCLSVTLSLAILTAKLSGTQMDTALIRQLALPVAIIFFIGIVDDLLCLPARYKLILQILVALVAIGAGIHFGPDSQMPGTIVLQGSLTILWLVLGTNAFNLIDGMDGLATGLGIVLSTTVAVAGFGSHDTGLTTIGVIFAACLLGFLRYNFSPASIFLGDSGSLTIGFLLSCMVVIWSNHQPTVMGRFAPVIAFSVPLADVFLSVGRRYLRRRPLFLGDRDHVHHRLLQRGLSASKASFLLYRAAALAAVIALVLVVSPPAGQIAAIGVFVILVIVLVKDLNYAEFGALWMVVSRFSPRRDIASHLWLKGVKSSLDRADRSSDCWPVVKHACGDLGFDNVRFVWRGRAYGEGADSSDAAPRWSLFVSINAQDSLMLSATFAGEERHRSVLLLLDLLVKELNSRSSPLEKMLQNVDELPIAQTPPITAR